MGRSDESALASLQSWDDDLFLEAATAELEPMMGADGARAAMARARSLLERKVDVEGLRSMVFQIIRNRDPEMKMNHVTELNLADAFAQVPGRVLEIERQASARNEKRVDFALEDAERTWLVEVKNLNAPVIKRAHDPITDALCEPLKGLHPGSDLHLVYLFFRRPRESDVPGLHRQLARAWSRYEGWERAALADLQESGVADVPLAPAIEARAPLVEFVPHDRPRVAALFTPARPDTGGRVIVYDHGDHLHTVPGRQIRAAQRTGPRGPQPRERVEELFVKDNIARRIQDSEGKFPLDNEGGRVVRVIAFYAGGWAPYSRLERYLRDVCHWYVHGVSAPADFWGGYYPFWTDRWRFDAQHNVDAVVALRGVGLDKPYQAVSLYSRVDGLLEGLFGARRPEL